MTVIERHATRLHNVLDTVKQEVAKAHALVNASLQGAAYERLGDECRTALQVATPEERTTHTYGSLVEEAMLSYLTAAFRYRASNMTLSGANAQRALEIEEKFGPSIANTRESHDLELLAVQARKIKTDTDAISGVGRR